MVSSESAEVAEIGRDLRWSADDEIRNWTSIAMGEMMSDTFGEALQKLACAKPSCPRPREVCLTDSAETVASESAVIARSDFSGSETPDPDIKETAISGQENLSADVSPREVSAESALTETRRPAAAAESDSPAFLRKPLQFLLLHRRQTAAVVTLVCMAVIWTEDGSSENLRSLSEPVEDLTSVESLLRDFDSIDSPKQQEPAEPLNAGADGFPLTIPRSHDERHVESGGSSKSHPAAAVAVYPDDRSNSGAASGSSFLIPNTTQPSPGSSTQDAASRSGVRFTGRIQPLK